MLYVLNKKSVAISGKFYFRTSSLNWHKFGCIAFIHTHHQAYSIGVLKSVEIFNDR